jgi:hypothetical protein
MLASSSTKPRSGICWSIRQLCTRTSMRSGRPLRLIATERQASDTPCANELVKHLCTKAVIAGKGYGSNAFVQRAKTGRPRMGIALCCIELGTSGNAFSLASSVRVVPPPATTSSQVTISPSLRLPVPLGLWSECEQTLTQNPPHE